MMKGRQKRAENKVRTELAREPNYHS